MNKILIIEDEENISTSLSIILEEEGFKVKICSDGKSGMKEYPDHDLVILDLMLPDMDGIEILKKIRIKSKIFPVIIISAKSREDDILEGLEYGADDYITKPFSIKELVLRVERSLERKKLFMAHNNEDDAEGRKTQIISFGNKNIINLNTLEFESISTKSSLTRQELEILMYLIDRKDIVVSRSELIRHIWGHEEEYESRTLDNFIVRFRKYFEPNPKKPIHFITKRGIGYLFTEKQQ